MNPKMNWTTRFGRFELEAYEDGTVKVLSFSPEKTIVNKKISATIPITVNKEPVTDVKVETVEEGRTRKLSLPGKVFSFATAIIAGTLVSEERQAKRVEICSTCPKQKVKDNGDPYCGVCGCKLAGGISDVFLLTAYEETDRYGCKHPIESQWKKNGV